VTFVDLEFETESSGGAPLGDIASSLVTIDELLRDLGTISAEPSTAEFREVRVVAIELRNPLKIRLSLLAIPAEAVKAFQDICREIIVFRERRADPLAGIAATLTRVTDAEAQRLRGHIVSLQRAAVPLKRVIVRDD
jgi:hypothetical protein